MAELLFELGIPVAVLLFAMIMGIVLEKRHFRIIRRREEELRHIPVLNGEELPDDVVVENATLVSGSVVVSIDYFKKFLASLRNIFGGEVKSYCSLLDRGRFPFGLF